MRTVCIGKQSFFILNKFEKVLMERVIKMINEEKRNFNLGSLCGG